MARPVTIFTGQWADMNFEHLCRRMSDFGFNGLELACWGDHFEVNKALEEESYCRNKWNLLSEYNLKCYAISAHLVGQAVCDRIDERHKAILPPEIWGDGQPEGVRRRAAEEMIRTAQAAKAFGVDTVVGFTGSPIWHMLYAFPPTPPKLIDEGYREFATCWKPILDEFQRLGIRFALEAHPTEIAFDIVTAKRTLEAIDTHPAFGFNFDPSHLGYQGVDYVKFLYEFSDRIFHVHMKDVTWSTQLASSGVFGGHLAFGDNRRYWDFRSLGRGRIEFEPIIRALNDIRYRGPLSVEWEDSGMDREYGAKEACAFVKQIDFTPGNVAFDTAFDQ